MKRIVNRYAETIPKSQASALASLLKEQLVNGEFRDEKEYKKELDKLTSILSSTNPIPLANKLEIKELTQTNTHGINSFVRKAIYDIDAIYTELNQILQIVKNHQEVFNNQCITDIRNLITLIDKEIGQVDYLLGNRTGYTDAQVFNFSQGSERASPVISDAINSEVESSLYYDPKMRRSIPQSMVLKQNKQTKVLHLPENTILERFHDAEVLDAFGPTDVLVAEMEELDVGYGWDKNQLGYIILSNYEISKRHHVEFGNTEFFKRQVYDIPEVAGDYVVLYDQKDADYYSELTGLPGLSGGMILFNAPISSASVVLGTISYGYIEQSITGIPSQLDIESNDSNILNTIDPDKNSFWMHHVLTKDKTGNGITVKVRFMFDGVRTVNHLVLTPISEYPFDIDEITMVDITGTEVLIDITVEKNDNDIRVDFNKMLASGFVVYFKLYTYRWNEYNLSKIDETSSHVRRGEQAEDTDVLNAIDNLAEKYKLEPVIGIIDEQDTDSYKQYTIGLRDVYSGYTQYKTYGALVFKRKNIDNLGLIGLSAIENNRYIGKETNLRGYFEYYLSIKEVRGNAAVSSKLIPILPSGISTVYEYLYPIDVEKDNKLDTRVLLTSFRAHATSEQSSHGFKIGYSTEEDKVDACGLSVCYQGNKLGYGEDWVVENLDVDGDPYTKIRIINAPDTTDTEYPVYEVAYIPWYLSIPRNSSLPVGSRTPIYADVDRTIRYHTDNTVHLIPRKSSEIEVTLLTIIRNGTCDPTGEGSSAETPMRQDLTPSIKSIKIGFGIKDPLKRFRKL